MHDCDCISCGQQQLTTTGDGPLGRVWNEGLAFLRRPTRSGDSDPDTRMQGRVLLVMTRDNDTLDERS